MRNLSHTVLLIGARMKLGGEHIAKTTPTTSFAASDVGQEVHGHTRQ
jgi:hypothetical protein